MDDEIDRLWLPFLDKMALRRTSSIVRSAGYNWGITITIAITGATSMLGVAAIRQCNQKISVCWHLCTGAMRT